MRATGYEEIDRVPLKQVEPRTGHFRGGLGSVACKKPYPVYVDQMARLFDVLSISAGMRGQQALLAPDHCIRSVDVEVVPIVRDKSADLPVGRIGMAGVLDRRGRP